MLQYLSEWVNFESSFTEILKTRGSDLESFQNFLKQISTFDTKFKLLIVRFKNVFIKNKFELKVISLININIIRRQPTNPEEIL